MGRGFVEVTIEKEKDFVLKFDKAYGALHDFPREKGDVVEEMEKEKESEKNIEIKEDKNNESANGENNNEDNLKEEKIIERQSQNSHLFIYLINFELIFHFKLIIFSFIYK